MGMNLDNMVNTQSDDFHITEQRFQELKTYMEEAEKNPEPGQNAHLNFAIDAMLDRWRAPAGTKRAELKKLVAKMHAKRIVNPESRIMYRVLKANLSNISVSVGP